MNKETEYTFLNNVDVENRVAGEFYISMTLKLGKWFAATSKTKAHLGGYCPVGEREKFEIWKKENKDLCMERPEKPETGAVCMHGGVEFRWCGKSGWRSEESLEKRKQATADWDKTPEGRKAKRFAGWKTRGIIFPSKKRKDKVYDCYGKATHCNNCETCKLTRHPEPYSNDTACLDHSYLTKLPRQIICHYCNSQEAYLRRVNKWKKDDPNFTRFAIINGVDVYLS